MKSLVGLLESLFTDVERMCGADLARDVKTLRSRVEHEGDGFLTIVLPSYCSDFERCLAEGRIGPGMFASFKKRACGAPAFLQGLLSKVFDEQGNLLEKASVTCIRAIRQICLMCKKVERPCSQERVRSATEAYLWPIVNHRFTMDVEWTSTTPGAISTPAMAFRNEKPIVLESPNHGARIGRRARKVALRLVLDPRRLQALPGRPCFTGIPWGKLPNLTNYALGTGK